MAAFDQPARHYDYRALAAWHRESGMRLELVCVEALISHSYLRALLTGAFTRPSIRLLERLAAVYGRDIGELFTDDAEPAGAR
jgi:transcriptional regulator with XRE-family HTH domain